MMFDVLFTIHLDTTSRMAYQGSTENRQWLPIDSTSKYYRGIHLPFIFGEERMNFNHPFYWDGHSNIVMTFIASRQDSYCCINMRTPIVPTTDTVSMMTRRGRVPYSETTVPDTCHERLAYRPDVMFLCDCDTTGAGCGKPLLYADSVFATTVRLRWSSGGGETSWKVEHCDTTRVWVVDDTAHTTRSYIYTGLDPEVEYYFRVTANCDDSVVQNRRDTTRAVTQCQPFALPLRDSLEGWPVGSSQPHIPNCWARTGYNPYITTDYAYSGQNSLCFHSESGAQTYLVLPAVAEDLRTLELSFRLLSVNDGPYTRGVTVGVMSDPADITTFRPLQNVTTMHDGVWEQKDVPLTASPLSGGYVAIITPYEGETMAYIDDIELDRYNPCRRIKNFRVSGVSQGSVSLSWDADSAGCAATVEYGPSGFEPGTGIEVQSAYCGVTITGLSADSTYDFYARRTCDSTVSRTAGPVQATVGRWNMRPYIWDTLALCGAELYDDSGPGIYSPYQVSAVTIVPRDSGTYVSISGYYTDYNYRWGCDTFAVYDGMDRTAPCLYSAGASGTVAVGPFTASNPQGALTVYYHPWLAGWGGVGFRLQVSCLDSVPPVCPMPAGLNVKDTTYNSATVFWSDTGLFEFAYKPASQPWWPVPVRDTANIYRLTGLHSIEAYDWHVRRVCSLNMSDWAVSTFTTAQSPCTRPVRFMVSDTGKTDATLYWRSTGDGEWQLRVLDSARVVFIDTAVTEPPVTVAGLTPHTTYSAVVRHLCGDTLMSEWTDTLRFTTGRDTTVSVPEVEGGDGFGVELYPNPAQAGTRATIEVRGANGEAVVSLYDLTGRRLRQYTRECPERCTIQFDINGLSGGTYFVKVHTRDKSAVVKLVVTN